MTPIPLSPECAEIIDGYLGQPGSVTWSFDPSGSCDVIADPPTKSFDGLVPEHQVYSDEGRLPSFSSID
jgi:hypothetical protein